MRLFPQVVWFALLCLCGGLGRNLVAASTLEFELRPVFAGEGVRLNSLRLVAFLHTLSLRDSL